MDKKRKAEDKRRRRQAQKDALVNRGPATNLDANQQLDATE
jgi:hypothetical protein